VGFTCQTGVNRRNLSSNSGFSGYLWQGDALPLSHFRTIFSINYMLSKIILTSIKSDGYFLGFDKKVPDI